MRQAVIQKAEERQRRQQPNLTGIPTQMKLDFEQRSGLSFDDVRVHYNSDKPRKIGALAYTQIPQVHIGPGQERHLRHELGHVVQQKQGIVRPTTYINGLPVNDSPSMERTADRIASGITGQPVSEQINLPRSPIQLYTETDIEKKHGYLSAHGHFFLEINGTLYATDEKIAEANVVLQKGDLICHRGTQLKDRELFEVLVTYDPEKPMNSEVLKKSNSVKNAATELLALDDEKLARLRGLNSGIKISADAQDILSGMCFFTSADTADHKTAFRQYLSMLATSNKIHLTTDCGELASELGNSKQALIPFAETDSPEVGDNLKIEGDESGRFMADYHWATVIMKDAADYITIEAADIPICRINGLEIRGICDRCLMKLGSDPTWEFRIYGDKDGETFVAKNSYLFEDNVKTFIRRR